ncbi:MAG: hypothetical protein Q4P18_05880 [Methanobrevibacter sp.]|uniref:Ig-like domain repeat protein n=1 Tax=Methanobrevibacter sp. TaxID=66852 RepID=UPI0026E112DF|nr:Ig-like domain repeat protein [Methanobrevibacter sp.]MDO5849042.1 hypothetical protein [Methanobrevibacter sp.]
MLICALVILLGSIAAISAEDYSVSGNFTNLNNAISHSSAGDVINVEDNITLQNSESSSYGNGIKIDHSITIEGNGHVIDAKSANNKRASVFSISNRANVIIKDLVIMNAFRQSMGGAITVASGCTLTLVNCTFIANEGVNNGGAIYSTGSLTVKGCNFENNTIKQGTAYGGAICVRGANLNVSYTNFTNNYCSNTAGGNDSSNGGAVSYYNGNFIQLSNCNFINNTAHGTKLSTAVGGAVYVIETRLVNITDCNFTGNSVNCERSDYLRGISRGGAIAVYDDKNHKDYFQYVTNCRFIGNHAEDAAGALRSTGFLTINNSYFAQNYLTTPDPDAKLGLNGTFGTAIANDRGGNLYIANTIIENHEAKNNNSYGTVFYHDNADIIFENVTMRNNYASYGGAIYNYNGDKSTFNITDSRFINNTALHGGAIFNAGQVLKINNTDFINNTALLEGGVISSDEVNKTSSTAILEVNNTRFINSTAKTEGGAVYANQGSPIFILNSYFTNSTANAGGAIYSKNNKNIIIDNTTFVYNNAKTNGGAILASNDSVINCSLSTFNDNKANVGGGISASSDSEVNLIECAFNRNSATFDGGAISANESSIINVVNSTLLDNNATHYGGAIAASTKVLVNMSNAVFKNNTALRGGAVYENADSSFIGVNSTFISNHATEYGGAIDGSLNVGIYLYNSTFNKNTVDDDGGAIYANVGSKIHIENTNFTNNSANGAGANSTGGAISGYKNVYIDISNSNFENNSAEYGGAIGGDYNSVIDVTNSTFIKNNASVLGGAISATENVRFNITNSTFDRNAAKKGGAISGDYNSLIDVQKSKFTNNSATTDGGAIAGLENVRVVVSDSVFEENTAVNGGAVSGDKDSFINITESSFENNRVSQNGGAINGAQVTISDSNLTKNKAGENGGAIYSSANSYIGYNNFNNNSALNNGSAIYSSGDKTIVKNTINEEDVEGFSSIYLTNDEYTRNATLTQNTIYTNLIPIYNDGNLIVSPTKLVIINNESYVVPINRTQALWAHLYDDNDNTIGSSSNVIITVWNPEKNFNAKFDRFSLDFDSAIPFKVEKVGIFPVNGYYNNAVFDNQTILPGLISTGNIPTDVVINIPNHKYNQTTRGTVNLTNEYGYNMSGNVTVVIDGTITIIVPIYDGLGYIVVNDTLMVGNHSATVKFAGDDVFLPSNNDTTFNVTKLDTKATITVPNIVEGDNITGTITLVDEYDKNITGNVTVNIANFPPFVVEVINGIANFTLNETLPQGIGYDAHVHFNETEIYNPSVNDTTFTVGKIKTDVSIFIPDHKVDEKVTGVVDLIDANGNRINGTVSVSINGTQYSVTVTNGKGTLLVSGLYAGNYTANVEYPGNSKYYSSANNTVFTVSKHKTPINLTVNQTDKDIIIFVEIPSDINDNVTITVDGKPYVVPVQNGTGKLVLPMLPEGNHTVAVEYVGNYKYLENSTDTTFTVSNGNQGDNGTHSNVSAKDKAMGENVEREMLKTGNPMVLLLLALFVLPIRRILKK